MEKTEKEKLMKKALLKEFFMTPNLLTFSRILLIPFFIWMMILRKPGQAFIIFLLAGFTDVLDGLAARLQHQKSQLGLWLDPAADKLLITAAFISLSLPHINHPNIIPLRLTFIVVGRDLLIALATLFLYCLRRQRIFPPSILGKVSTVSQVLTVLLVLIFNSLNIVPFNLIWIYDATLVAAILSGIQYAYTAFPAVFHKDNT